MTAGALFVWLALLVPISVVLLVLCLAAIRLLGWQGQNYAGESIPTGYGVAFPALALAAVGLAMALGSAWTREAIIVCAAVLGCGAFGLLDDLYGRASPKGLAGHFRLLIERRQLTAGQLKAVGVAAVGITVGALIWGRLGAEAVVSGALVALCANAANLLDTRPGRALTAATGAYALIGIAVAASGTAPSRPLAAIAPVALGCLVALPVDLGRRAMLGDVGAYALGGGIGVALTLILPVWAQITVAVVLICFTVLADRYSLSAFLAGRPQPDDKRLRTDD
ncbi:MAG: hypothetical protein PVH68_16400 [Armatimonadota bacterium]|jgi:UDP-N-acetylmuramyl pentapeptide phosphotransferase/UDP-N-acetylglucosamine-1-phosphate transferase